jgi:hypothetical protein
MNKCLKQNLFCIWANALLSCYPPKRNKNHSKKQIKKQNSKRFFQLFIRGIRARKKKKTINFEKTNKKKHLGKIVFVCVSYLKKKKYLTNERTTFSKDSVFVFSFSKNNFFLYFKITLHTISESPVKRH